MNTQQKNMRTQEEHLEEIDQHTKVTFMLSLELTKRS